MKSKLLAHYIDSPISAKLRNLGIVTNLVSIILMGVLFISYDYFNSRKALLSEIDLLSTVVSKRVEASLLFDQPETVKKDLADLEAKSSIMVACVFDANDNLIASFIRDNSGAGNCEKITDKDEFAHFSYNDLTMMKQIGQQDGFLYLQSNLNQLYDQMWRTVTGMALVLIIIFILVSKFSYFLQHLISRPISELTDISLQVSESKDYTMRAEVDAKDEIGQLAVAFNQMMSEIESSHKKLNEQREKLKQFNTTLEDTVRLRTLELEHALEVKSRFLSNMSHEIRTPIHGVINFANFLKYDWETLSEERKHHFVDTIHLSSTRLYDLINNILDLSKLDTKEIEFSMRKNDLVAVTKKIIYASHSLYEGKKDIKLTLVPDEEEMLATFDVVRIEQVLCNLYGNAIKFTSHGTIEAKIEWVNMTQNDGTESEGIRFTLSDEGVGIPETELEHIFGRFSESSLTKTQAGGTGLGLAICRNIVEVHRGRIWAENRDDKQGARLIFELPKVQIELDVLSDENELKDDAA